jgi:hypothetical protein
MLDTDPSNGLFTSILCCLSVVAERHAGLPNTRLMSPFDAVDGSSTGT